MTEDPTQVKKVKPMTLARNTLCFLFIYFVELTALALQLDSKQARTAFGKLSLSDEKPQPVFGF
jgi:hypothetical protein